MNQKLSSENVLTSWAYWVLGVEAYKNEKEVDT